MGLLRHWLPSTLVACGITASTFAVEGGFSSDKQSQERDFEALQEYIKTKRAITVREKGGNLMISGDIRGEWYHMKAKTDGEYQRGWSSRHLPPNKAVLKAAKEAKESAESAKNEARAAEADKNGKEAKKKWTEYRKSKEKRRAELAKLKPPYAINEFDIEANLLFDYVADRGWGTVRLQMNNSAGTATVNRTPYMTDSRNIMYGSGVTNDLVLRKCFAGYNFWEQGTSRFDMEIGRRRLYDAFDSKIQFWSWFDGVLARFTTSVEGVADFSAKAAAFVVDHSVNHYGYVGELGFLNLGDTGVDLKYSLIHWGHKRPNRFEKCHARGSRFLNSQIVASYSLSPDIISLKTQLYAAYLVNHRAPNTSWTHHKKAGDAYYIGGRIGEALRKGDYAVELFYQWVKAQAIPEGDLSSSARDNPTGTSFQNARRGGRANFRGWRLEGFYAITDNWTLNAHLDSIREMDRHIGGKHRSTEFYLGAVFAF